MLICITTCIYLSIYVDPFGLVSTEVRSASLVTSSRMRRKASLPSIFVMKSHAWICPIEETVLKKGCVKFKKRKIEIAVSLVVTMIKKKSKMSW